MQPWALESSLRAFRLPHAVWLISLFLQVGKNVDKWLWMLGARRVLARGDGDCDAVRSKHGSIEADFRAWKTRFISRLQALQKGETSCGGNCRRGKCESKQHGTEDEEPEPHALAAQQPRDTEVCGQPSLTASLHVWKCERHLCPWNQSWASGWKEGLPLVLYLACSSGSFLYLPFHRHIA